MNTTLNYYLVLSLSLFCGLYALYYSFQGIIGKFEFKTDRKLFVSLCIITTITDFLSFLMYKKILILHPQWYFFPIHFYILLQHILLCMLYSCWLSPMEKKYAYYNAIGMIILWCILKITNLEPFNKIETVTVPISHFFLFIQSFHFIVNLDKRTTTNPKIDPLHQIGSVNVIYFGLMTLTFSLVNYNKFFWNFVFLFNIFQYGYYIYALYLFSKKTNFEIHDWL